MFTLQNISYFHPNRDLLFSNISFTVNKNTKSALVGNNGAGKSTLLRIMAKELEPSEGNLIMEGVPYYVPQVFGQYNHLTIAQALNIDIKLRALHEILRGNVTENLYDELNDDWSVEDRCREALEYWQLTEIDLFQKMGSLSGGQKTKVFLAGIHIHRPEFVLLDEPSNHLDMQGRQLLYDFIRSTAGTVMVVSHDRVLLNLLDTVYELNGRGITSYGGNYSFFCEQKRIERESLAHDVLSKEKALKKAKEKERETQERQQKADARGKKKQEKAGVARIMMNTLRNGAENSTARLKGVHEEKIGGLSEELRSLRTAIPNIDKIQFGFGSSSIHRGKMLFQAAAVNYRYRTVDLWKNALSFQIMSGDRVALMGTNGSGKTTLIRLLTGDLEPFEGVLMRAQINTVYIDQDYSAIRPGNTVYEQAQMANTDSLPEHEVKTKLSQFLFTRHDWDKPCEALSGGERMRLLLCCLTISINAPDVIILDEPTNNLDVQNIEILTKAINEYKGTLIVVSHDVSFLDEINIEKNILI